MKTNDYMFLQCYFRLRYQTNGW